MEEEFVVFLDETGDHSLQHIDKEYPVFALGALYCRYEDYINIINTSFDNLKYKFFGKRHILLHSTDIRGRRKDFNILLNADTRNQFVEQLNHSMMESPFHFSICLIDKLQHSEQYTDPDNPYDLTLSFIMERSFFLIKKKHPDAKCRFIAESRNPNENAKLLKSFENFKDTGTGFISSEELQFITKLDFVKKDENETGHQIVDLCLYPLARTYITGVCHPSLPAFYSKIYKSSSGSPIGYGIKTFPKRLSTDLVREIESMCLAEKR